MTSTDSLLATLQHADSFFPAGGIAFSWGMETLIADGMLSADCDLETMLVGQLQERWAVFDRCALVAAYEAASEIQSVAAIDRQVEAMILARELREGSRRAGSSLLSVHDRLGTPKAAEYRALLRAGDGLGHLPVMQGMLWRGAGINIAQAQAVSAHTFCVSLLGAVLRLGAIGHLQAQETLLAVHTAIARLLEAAPPTFENCYAFTPMAEIAAMRHEAQSSRLFAN
jgi:urease accessory protein